MKLWLIVTAALIAFALFAFAQSRGPYVSAGTPAIAQTSPMMSQGTPVISTNEGGCWDKCKTCESKCKDNQACKEKCWSTNDSCCGGVGGKGVYKLCGCTDK